MLAQRTATDGGDAAVLGDHIDRLYRAAWALCGSREEAEDLVQETYVRVLARPRRIRRGGEVAYLLKALRNTFAGQRRRRRHQVTSLVEAADPAELRTEVIPHEAAEATEVLAAVASLPAHHRDVTIAVDLVGLSYEEAAGALGVPAGTVRSRLHAARGAVVGRLAAADVSRRRARSRDSNFSPSGRVFLDEGTTKEV